MRVASAIRTDVTAIASPISTLTVMITNSPVSRILRRVSFSCPSRAPTEMAMCGGVEVIIMKKLNGARLCRPSAPTVDGRPVGAARRGWP
jgi:hypothetical protein